MRVQHCLSALLCADVADETPSVGFFYSGKKLAENIVHFAYVESLWRSRGQLSFLNDTLENMPVTR